MQTTIHEAPLPMRLHRQYILIQFMCNLHIHPDSAYVTGRYPWAARCPQEILSRDSSLSCSSLHSSALTLSSKMAGSPVIDCKLTRICCQNCVECELHPVFCVNTKYLKLTLCTPTDSCRAWSTAPRCSSSIEYKNQDVTTGCAWPCRVTSFQAFFTATDERFSLPRMNTFHCHG